MMTELRTRRQLLQFLGGGLLFGCGQRISPSLLAADEEEPPPTLEEVLLKQIAPEIIRVLQKKDCSTVGVLQFRVADGGIDGGVMNRQLTEGLRAALILENPNKAPLAILRDAGALISKLKPPASPLNAADHMRMLATKGPLVWGENEVAPDALLTGLATVSPDLLKMNIQFQAFGRGFEGLETVAEAEVRLTVESFLQLGRTFEVRGISDDRQIARRIAEDRRAAKPFPLDGNDGLKFRVFYDDEEQVIGLSPEGVYIVIEPRHKQRVRFELSTTGDPVAVVVRVNGENTLFRERRETADCTKWIVRNNTPTVIRGYQLDENNLDPFEVLSETDSRIRDSQYGAAAGLITINVIPELRSGETDVVRLPEGDLDETSLNAVRNPQPLKTRVKNARSAKEMLQNASKSFITRGTIAPPAPDAKKEEQVIQRVEFKPNFSQMQTVAIRYRAPHRGNTR